MTHLTSGSYISRAQAKRDFRAARRRALAEARTNTPRHAQSFDAVARATGPTSLGPRHLMDMPLKHVVGSVDRARDFSPSFLPLNRDDEEHWANVELAVQGDHGVAPVEAYQLGEVYFIVDGHTRVAVLKWLGASHVEAYVQEVFVQGA